MKRSAKTVLLAGLAVLAGIVTSPSPAEAGWTEACGIRVWVDPPTDHASCMANGRKMGCSRAANLRYCAKFSQRKGSGSRALK